MSYTPPEEAIEEAKEQFIGAAKDLSDRLYNRAVNDGGGWDYEHKQKCKLIYSKILDVIMSVSNL